MSEDTSFITGLASSLNLYMGHSMKLNQDLASKKQEIDYSEAAKERGQNNVNEAELKRQKNLEAYKQSLEGSVDPDTSNALLPDSGDMVTAFKKMNGRYPTVKEHTDLMKSHPDSKNLSMIQPETFGHLAEVLGADENTVAGIKGLKGPIPTGLATEALKNVFDKGLKESTVFKMYTEIMPSAAGKSPDQLGEDWIKFKTGIMEPGKTAITSEKMFNNVSQAAEAVVQKAMQDGKTPEQAMAIGAQVVSKYDHKSKAKLLFRIMSDAKNQEQPAQPQPEE
jgi:hypothetical protein